MRKEQKSLEQENSQEVNQTESEIEELEDKSSDLREKKLIETEEYIKAVEELRKAQKKVRQSLIELGKKAVVDKIDKMVEGPKSKFSRLTEKITQYKQDVKEGFKDVDNATRSQKRNIRYSAKKSDREDAQWSNDVKADGRSEKVANVVYGAKKHFRDEITFHALESVGVTGKIAKAFVPIEKLFGKKDLAKRMVERVGARGERRVEKDSKIGNLLQRVAKFGFKTTDKARNVKVTAKEKINNTKNHIIEAKDKTLNAVRSGTKPIRNKARTIGQGARLTAGIGILLAEKLVKLPVIGARAGAKLAKQAGRNVKESVQNAQESVKTRVEQVKIKSIESILETLSSVQQRLDKRLSEEKVYAQREENPYSMEEVEQKPNKSNENELEDNFDVDVEIPTVEKSGGTANYVDISTGNPETLVEKGMRILEASLGHTHSSEPSSTGTMNGQEYVSLKRLNVSKDMNGQTIITNDGVYDISIPKDGRDVGNYTERLTLGDGSKTYFSSQLNGDRVYSSRSKDGITFTESAGSATMANDSKVFEEYAQPSKDEEIAEEYARVTGLPKVQSGSYETSLNSMVRNEDPKNTYPYVVKLEATKEDSTGRRTQSKSVQYVYSSAEQYKSGEQPSMIYIEGLDGRSEESGMFRKLPDGSYIDNSTFRKENGEYTYDTMTYDEITELTGKFPAELSKKAELAAKGEFRIPSEVKKVYDEAIKGPQNRENQENSKDEGDVR